MPSPQTAVGNLLARINAHDARLSDLAKLESGWAGYFALFPDYRIDVETMLSRDALVLLTGSASATHRATGRSWRIPAAWRALVSEHLIAEWQVYADNKPVYEILSSGP